MRGLASKLRLEGLQERHGIRPAAAAFTFVNGAISIGLLSVLAWAFASPLIFPSLGPTAFLLFHRPLAASASPRNTVLGHLIGAVLGYASLVLFGLTEDGSAIVTGVTWPRVGAAALSLGGTSGLMVLASAAHPPAGATTLIVSLGILDDPVDLVVLMTAVVLLVVQGAALNRLAGIRYPLWAARDEDQD